MGLWAQKVALATVLLCACGRTDSLPYYGSSDLTPHWSQSEHRIAPFDLTDQSGRRITNDDVRDKVYVASFFFTSCKQICPKLKSSLARVQDAFGSESRVLILSHTVLPEADSVSVLARYARVNGVRPDKWLLLRGDRPQLERLATRSYFVELKDTTGNTRGNLVHTEVLVLVDGSGHIRGVYDGTLAYEVSRLIEDTRVLLKG